MNLGDFVNVDTSSHEVSSTYLTTNYEDQPMFCKSFYVNLSELIWLMMSLRLVVVFYVHIQLSFFARLPTFQNMQRICCCCQH